LKTPAITIRGTDIVVDFNGAELVGSPDGADPDTFAGVAILVDAVLRSHGLCRNAAGHQEITLTSTPPCSSL
jgi:hypothetical protein